MSEKKPQFPTTNELAYGAYTSVWGERVWICLKSQKLQIHLLTCGTKSGNMCSRGNCKIIFHSGIWANDCVVWVMHICNPCGKLRGRRKVSVIHWGLASRNHLFRKIYMGWNNLKNVLSGLSACEHSRNHSTPISAKTEGGISFCYFLVYVYGRTIPLRQSRNL